MGDLMWSNCDVVVKILINTILVSIPEEFYILMLTLILVGEFDYWMEDECKKLINPWDYSRILIPVISVALLSNVLRYSGFDSGVFSIIPIGLFFILIVITNDVLNDASALKWIGKTFVLFVISFITVGLTELIYVPIILYGTGKTISDINANLLLNFLVSIPGRVIQLLIIFYLITKKRTFLKGKMINYIIKSPILSVIASLLVVFDLLFLFVMYRVIVFEKVLISISHFLHFTIIIGVIIFPILNIAGLMWSVYYAINKEVFNKKNALEKLDNLESEIDLFTNKENYDNIIWKLNNVRMLIYDIKESLNK